MTLNKVDLPQPDGPITDRNSPGRTSNDTSSTATTPPSAVSKRTMILSATRMASLALGEGGILFALAGHDRGHGGGVAGLDAHIDNSDGAGFHRRDRLGKNRIEFADGVNRAEALRALRACHRRDVDVRLGYTLA